MSPEAFFSILGALILQTSALAWWGATLTATVKHHERKLLEFKEALLDHESRLRKAQL